MHDSSPAVSDPSCRNCSAELAGPYCAQCGQHAHESARSLHVLFHEAWHLLTHLDGRLWRTLVLLLFRPGRLSLEYFADRRARYVPPFQLYFVISVAFFGLAALSNSGSSTHDLTPTDRAQLNSQLQQPDTPTLVTDSVAVMTAEHGVTPQLAAQLCRHVTIGVSRLDPRLQAVCRRQFADGGRSMMHEFGSLVPKMMFVFLPLMALVMLALYHTPQRFYVEHLVFFLHLQSDLFLVLILRLLLLDLATALPAFGTLSSIGGPVLFCYAVWYVFAALRHFYGQGRGRTFAKFGALVVAYLVCIGLSLLGTMVLSALVT